MEWLHREHYTAMQKSNKLGTLQVGRDNVQSVFHHKTAIFVCPDNIHIQNGTHSPW